METESYERLGSYLLGPRIGRGASGVVRHATSTNHTEPVAIKILREDLADDERTVARFLREKRIISDVDHPNVVKVHDLVVEEDQLGIVMELVDGGDLRALLKSGSLTASESVELTRQIAVGLTHLHELGILHRDLKPANVLVGGDGDDRVAKITDFGVSWLVGETMTRLTTTVGTPIYMAPEIADTGGPAEASDVYALGVMLYEMLTGASPFHGGSPMAIIMAHSRNPTPELRGVPSGLAALVSAMMAKIPTARPTAAEVADRLEALVPLVDDEAVVSTASPITGQKILSEEEPPPPVAVEAAAAGESDGLVPAAVTGVLELFRRQTELAVGTAVGLLLLIGVLFAVTRDDTESVAADAPDSLPSADESGSSTSEASESSDRGSAADAPPEIGEADRTGAARGRFGGSEVALGPTSVEPQNADDALAPVGPSTSRPAATPNDRSGTTERSSASTTDRVTSSSRVTSSTSTSTSTTGPTTTRLTSTTRPTSSTATTERTTTTRPTTTTERTTTTRRTTTTERVTTTTRPTTTTTRPTTTTERITTTSNQGLSRRISIVSGPRVVTVGRTSAVFTYTTNQVCGTGSFTYREQATGRVVGGWTGDRGCFGPTHEGRTSWGGGIALEPGTTYVVSITVEGQPTNGSLPTGTGQASTSLIVTTAP